MPNKKNTKEVKNLEESLNNVKALFIADYSGLDVKSQQELREKVKEAGGELKVTKNTLLKIALKNKGFDIDSMTESLEGQNITLLANSDAISPLKVIVEYAKNNEKPVIKAGFLGKEQLSLTSIKSLSELPSKSELLARLIGQIQAPVYGIVNVLTAPARNLVYALNAIKEKKN